MLDDFGRVIHGEFKTGAEYKEGLAAIKGGQIDLGMLDQKVEEICAKLLETFPECMTKSLEELPQAQARRVEPQQGKLPRVALSQHDERGPHRFSRIQRGDEGDRARDRFRKAAPGVGQGHPWSEALVDSLMPGVGRQDPGGPER